MKNDYPAKRWIRCFFPYLTTLLIFILKLSEVHCQDTIFVKAGVSWHQSSKNNFQSHYLLNHQEGVVKDVQSQFLLHGGVSIPFTLTEKLKFESGANYILKPGDYKSYLNEIFFRANFDMFEFRIGREIRKVGINNQDLSTGSLGVSQNARPLPIIGAGIKDYVTVPFTKGYVKFKGYLIHGWFEKERYIESPWLHEKWAYFKFMDPLPVSIFGGFVHYAQWAGIHPTYGQLPNSFKDYLKVFVGEQGDGGPGGEVQNALGNHMGTIDFGIDIKLDKYNIHLYHQKPWDDYSGLMVILEDPDRLFGLDFELKEQKLICNILYEYIHTYMQSGKGIPDPTPTYPTEQDNYGHEFGGRDDYYNNYIYKSGWTYHDMIIGTPLFYTQARARKFLPNLSDTYGNIVNNRVIGHHFGIQGKYKILKYRLLSTYTRNYGTYAGANKGRYNWASIEEPDFNYEFNPPLDQLYFLIDTQWEINNNLSGICQLGIDTGEIYDNFGFHLGINYTIGLPYHSRKVKKKE